MEETSNNIQQVSTPDNNSTTLGYIGPAAHPAVAPCPSCGYCPTCGRHRNNWQYPYWYNTLGSQWAVN